MLKVPRRPHVAELLLREIFLPLVRNQNHLNDATVAGVSKIFMPTLLSSTSFLLKEFWGLKKSSVKEGIVAPDPLPRFEKLEPAHASSVVSFTRASSYLMAAFIGVLVRQSIYIATFLRVQQYCNGVDRGFKFCFIMFATISFV